MEAAGFTVGRARAYTGAAANLASSVSPMRLLRLYQALVHCGSNKHALQSSVNPEAYDLHSPEGWASHWFQTS
jgi:hypothetical protein